MGAPRVGELGRQPEATLAAARRRAARGREEDGDDVPLKTANTLVRSRVSLEAVRGAFVSESGVRSNLGAMLDRAKAGGSPSTDYQRAQEPHESALLGRAAIIRCVDALASTVDLLPPGEAYTTLRATAKRSKFAEGAVVVAVLRVYEPWASASRRTTKEERAEGKGEYVRDELRALAEVHGVLRRHDPSIAAPADEGDTAEAFCAGKAKRARNLVALAAADDDLLALSSWVTSWNGRSVEKAPVMPERRSAV